MILLQISVLILLASKIQCAKILAIFPMPAKSHYILGSALMRGLAEKGHDVTVISPFGEKNKPKNGTYKDILLNDGEKEMNFDLFEFEGLNPIVYNLAMNGLGNKMTEQTFNDSNVQKLLKSSAKFDVVIVEHFINDAHKVFAHHYNCPLVSFVTFGSSNWVNPLVANPAPPSYVPELQINFDHTLFFDRMKNVLLYILGELNRHLLFFPAQDKLMHKYFPGAPALAVLNYNISLILLNSHWSTNTAVPRVPNMVDIGGYHVQKSKELPKDLRKFLDDAPDGVIYFSMGSALKSVNLPGEKRKILLDAFSKLKEKVLWKWESDDLPGKPENVKIGKWLPQQDILAHPNIKLFITHGGLLSLIESVYHGVPVLPIPIFGDQKINAAEAVWSGFGLSVSYTEITEELLSKTIAELLNNPKYSQNMKKRSKIMHDRQNSPLDDAAYWIEYVIRHQGAPHLRVAGLDLAWYQYTSIDIFAFLAIVLFVVLTSVYFLLNTILNQCKGPNKVKLS